MNECGMSIKRYLRKQNSKELEKAAATDGEYGKLAKVELERQLQVDAEPLQSERVGNSYIALAHAAVKSAVDDACSRASRLRFSIGKFSVGSRTPTLEERRASILKRIDENRSFGRMLMRLVSERCDGKASICYKGAGVSRQIYSRIISDPTPRVSRRTAFQLCVGLRLTCEEADAFIKAAGYAFGSTEMESQVFAYCLSNRILNIFDINDLLCLCGCEPIAVN